MLNYDGKKRWSLEQQVAINKDKNKQNENAIEEIKHDLTSVYKIKGSRSCASLNGLTKILSLNGNVYNVTDAGTLTNADSSTVSVNVGDNVLFIWNNGDWYWDILAGIVDLSNYVEKIAGSLGVVFAYGNKYNVEGAITCDSISTPSTIVFRNSAGNFACADMPVLADGHTVTNKNYVDSNHPNIIRG